MLFGFSSTFLNPSFRVLIFLFILAPSTLIKSQECYFPDGSLANTDYPCLQVSSDSNFTFCCGNDDWICSSNKVCTKTTGPQILYARGSCTDVSWQSSGCPHFCKQSKSAVWTVLILWGGFILRLTPKTQFTPTLATEYLYASLPAFGAVMMRSPIFVAGIWQISSR